MAEKVESIESGESGEISSSSCDSKNKKEYPINDYLDLFIHDGLNHITIRSRLVRQLENELISINEQLCDATDLSPITFSKILSTNPSGKISTILKLVWKQRMRIKNLK